MPSLPVRATTATFLLAALAIVATAGLLAQRLAAMDAPEALAVGITLDLTVVLPALFYALVARPRGWSPLTVLPVLLAGAWLAGYVLPDAYDAPVRLVYLAIPLVEVALLGVVLARAGRVVRATRASDDGDVLARLRAGFGAALPRAAAEALAYEAAVLRYALGPAAPLPVSAREVGRFAQDRTSSYRFVLVAGLLAGAVELVGVHLLLAHVAPGWQALHLAVSGYALVWLWGDYRAVRQRPTTLTDDALHVRLGLRWSVDVPLGQIADVRRVTKASALEGADGYLGLGGFDAPQLLLVLHAPVEAVGPYGWRREATLLGVRADDADALAEAVLDRAPLS